MTEVANRRELVHTRGTDTMTHGSSLARPGPIRPCSDMDRARVCLVTRSGGRAAADCGSGRQDPAWDPAHPGGLWRGILSSTQRRPPPLHCLNVTCVQCENGKSISPIYSAQPTMAHDADTDSDLARPPDGKHPSARNATPARPLWSAMRRRTTGHVVAHPGPSDSE